MNQLFRRRAAAVWIIIISLIFPSCSTFMSNLQARMEGAPSWIFSTPSNTFSTVYFTGEGRSDEGVQEIAEEQAYLEILEEVTDYVEIEIDQEVRDQLFEERRMDELAVTVEDTFQRSEEGASIYHVLAKADRKTINDYIRKKTEEVEKLRKTFTNIADQAQRAYNRQEDLRSLNLYLKAAETAYRTELAGSRDMVESYLSRAVSILRDLRLKAGNRSERDRTFPVKVQRGEGVFANNVVNAPIKVNYSVKNTEGGQIPMEREVVSNERGDAAVTVLHSGFRGNGVLTMQLELSAVEATYEIFSDDPELKVYFDTLRSLKEELSLTFSYAIYSEYLTGRLLVSFLEFDRNNRNLESQYAMDAFTAALEDEGITAKKSVRGGFSDVNQLGELIAANASDGYDRLIAASMEIINIKALDNRYIATTEGIVRITDMKTGQDLRTPERLAANGIGMSRDEAVAAAFTRFGQIAAVTLLNAL